MKAKVCFLPPPLFSLFPCFLSNIIHSSLTPLTPFIRCCWMCAERDGSSLSVPSGAHFPRGSHCCCCWCCYHTTMVLSSNQWHSSSLFSSFSRLFSLSFFPPEVSFFLLLLNVLLFPPPPVKVLLLFHYCCHLPFQALRLLASFSSQFPSARTNTVKEGCKISLRFHKNCQLCREILPM